MQQTLNVQAISSAKAQKTQRNDSFFSMTAVWFAEFLKNRQTLVCAGRQKKKSAISVYP
jgi:hypothetical protein